MTWSKLGDEFPDECAAAGLSDAAFRTHVEGMCWTMRRETGGQLDRRDLRRFAETADPEATAAELVAAGFWVVDGDGWRIRHHMEHQPDPEVIAKRRDKTAERVRRHRRRQAGLPSDAPVTEPPPPAVMPAVTPLHDALPGSGRDGSVPSPLEPEERSEEEPPARARDDDPPLPAMHEMRATMQADEFGRFALKLARDAEGRGRRQGDQGLVVDHAWRIFNDQQRRLAWFDQRSGKRRPA